jgi:hypothetical protein
MIPSLQWVVVVVMAKERLPDRRHGERRSDPVRGDQGCSKPNSPAGGGAEAV